ncbi:MAG: flagellar biosynthesis protein FlhA [Opitutales bacterium]|nr:flagellar biosynthesis protein FlhA [Opitutales bacterium]
MSLKASISALAKRSDVLLSAGLFGTVFLLVLPIAPMFMDVLLTMSIGMALMILLLVLYVKDPPEFNLFPTILLATTLFRLGLNVASTRLILLDGYAGQVIDTFGNFVVRGNYVVGTVVFLILVIINFVVITKGSGRIAEVAARFTLDAMPGKQMSIDAELNAGSITEQEANRRRQGVQAEADFYGAMDGASKFVRGDAIAGILITLINVVGGILIGVFQKGLDMNAALQKYTLLSIGDGLVSQIPALMISIGAGLLITRSNESSDLGEAVSKQLFSYPRAVMSLGVMLIIFGILPGMPKIPFFVFGGSAIAFARYLNKVGIDTQVAVAGAVAGGSAAHGGKGAPAGAPLPEGQKELGAVTSPEQDFKSVVSVDPFAIELGYGLLPLTNKRKENDLIERVTGVRRTFAREMGILVPPIAIRDNLELDTNEYRFLLRNKEVGRSSLVPNRWLAMNVSNSPAKLKGISAVEPVFGIPATWIHADEKKTAEVHGYTVVDAASVLITHLTESLRDHASSLLEREDTQKLIDMVKQKNPTLISELLPDLVNVGLIQRVLQNLLREKVAIKNLTLILETIADYAGFTKNPDDLSEQVRRKIGTYFVSDYEAEPGILKALTIEPSLEQALAQRVKRTQFEIGLMMDPSLAHHILEQMKPRIDEMLAQGLIPLVITTGELRLAFQRFFEPSFPRLAILSYQEIPSELQIQNIGIISAPIDSKSGNAMQTPLKGSS